ncbi:SDR family oxidoreductase [bacterium]|jgi:NAD(P)-dependent dehydrogenase (short-subunit alcohol dehydrogenase family)|nr:SDR family oxidoreductase [bacterium]
MVAPQNPLSGRIAVVTGATSGIGEATAVALAGAGAMVIASGRDSDRGLAVVDRIRHAGGEGHFHPADLRSTAEIDELVASTVRRFGRLDIAFNNAGIFDRSQPFSTYSDDEWDDMIAVNLTAVFRCMRAEVASMVTTGGGVIINNASTVAHRGSERASAGYVAAKHGVIGLTRQAALEHVDRGIRVNAVSPGPTQTPVTAALETEGPDAVSAALASLNPTGKFISAHDVAATVVFLCSDAAAMINGHDIALDGGQLAKL